MRKKRIIPFGLTLAGLTLKGKPYQIAKAHYDLDGIDLERRLLEIDIEDQKELTLKLLSLDKKYGNITDEEYENMVANATLDGKELEEEQLKIQRKYKHITKEEYDYKLVDIKYRDEEDNTNLRFARLELDKKYGKLTEKQFDKAVYSMANKPWVDVIHSEYNDNDGSDGFTFELDWNEAFIKLLRSEGYSGATEDAIVEQWFEDKALDTYLGVLAEHMAEIGEDPEDAHRDREYGRGRTLKETLGDKKTRHS